MSLNKLSMRLGLALASVPLCMLLVALTGNGKFYFLLVPALVLAILCWSDLQVALDKVDRPQRGLRLARILLGVPSAFIGLGLIAISATAAYDLLRAWLAKPPRDHAAFGIATTAFTLLFLGLGVVMLKGAFRHRSRRALDAWFHVSFDDTDVHIDAHPPGRRPWQDAFPWASIVRVCFKDEGLAASDGLYIFTTLRPESFVIPTEADGGEAFFAALCQRGRFPDSVFRRAMASTNGGIYCWPAVTEPTRAP